MISGGRFTWLFATPNQAAIACAMAALIGIWLWSLRTRHAITRHHRLPLAVSLVAAVVCVMSLYLLAATHSRAGWIGYIVGCATLWLWRCVDFRAAAVSVILLFAFVLVTPGGAGRFASVMDGTAPGGRFDAWRSALCLIFDYPLTGIGADFPGIYGSWYLPKEYDQRFFTALNDALTFAGWYGLPALAIVTAAIASFYLMAWDLRDSPMAPLLALGLSLVSLHVVMGQFQAHLWWPFPRYTGAFSLLLVGAGFSLGIWHSHSCPWLGSRMATAAAIGVIAGAALYIGAWVAATASSTRTSADRSGHCIATSRRGSEQGSIVLLVDDDGERKRVCHGLSLNLMRRGFGVIVSQGMRKARTAELIRSGSLLPTMIVSCGESCAQAYALADKAPTIAIDPSDMPPSPSIDQRLLIITSRDAPFTASPSDIERCTSANPGIEHHRFDRLDDGTAALAIAAWASAPGRR